MNIIYARYKELTQKQSEAHDALRAPILHLLEILKADKQFLQTNGFLDPVQVMTLPDLLGRDFS